jgi:hypothetical protein
MHKLINQILSTLLTLIIAGFKSEFRINIGWSRNMTNSKALGVKANVTESTNNSNNVWCW